LSGASPGPAPPRPVPWLAIACGALALAHCALFLGLANLPILDLPNHSARARVMADLLFQGGARFGTLYTLQPGIVPYLGAGLLQFALPSSQGEVFGSDWSAVQREWPYLLVLGPLERLAAPLGTRTVATRPYATLLEVEAANGALSR